MNGTNTTKIRHRRVMTALYTAWTMIMLFTMPVYATEADAAMDTLAQKMFDWYIVIRNLSCPLLVLSFASCGFRFLGAGILSRGENTLDGAMKQMWFSISALLVIIFLPNIMGAVKDLLSATAWQPPEPAGIDFGGG